MLIDSRASGAATDRVADVLLVGGGTCGLLLADALREAGMTVTVVESGSAQHDPRDDELNATELVGRPYAGATEGRQRGLGGTSLLWGGAMLPFLAQDLAPRAHVAATGWPVAYGELAEQIPRLERIFGLVSGPYDAHFLGAARARADGIVDDEDFVSRFAKWPSFRQRNTAHVFGPRLRGDPDLHVHLSTTVTQLLTAAGDAARIVSVEAITATGQVLTLKACQVVICAGAIESTRLLLMAARGPLAAALGEMTWLGRGFHDHLSVVVAEVIPRLPQRLNRLAGFRFQGRTMRSFRLELNAQAQQREQLPSAWWHIAFEGLAPSGFDALRDLMRKLQQGRPPAGRDLSRLLLDTPYLLQLGWWRVVRQQLRWPALARYQITVVAEQLPRPENRIELSTRLDRHGQPLPRLSWQVAPSDLETIRRTALLVRRYWAKHCESRIGPLRWRLDPDQTLDPDVAALSDIFHPGGTTRMGTTVRDGVVDGNLRVLGMQNLHVLSTSTFPTGASANPTMTLLLLALRLSRHLQQTRLAAP